MSTLKRTLLIERRGPAPTTPHMFTADELARAAAQGTWPYVRISEDVWLRHHALPILVYSVPDRILMTPLAKEVMACYPHMFPDTFEAADAGVRRLVGAGRASFVLEGVDDLLERRMERLDAFTRAHLLMQALAYGETLAQAGLSLENWEMGVRLSSTPPRIKLLLPHSIVEDWDVNVRANALDWITGVRWNFHRLPGDAAAEHAWRELVVARRALDGYDTLLGMMRRILEAFAAHPRVHELEALVLSVVA